MTLMPAPKLSPNSVRIAKKTCSHYQSNYREPSPAVAVRCILSKFGERLDYCSVTITEQRRRQQ